MKWSPSSDYKTLGKRMVRHMKALRYLTVPRLINVFILLYEIKLRKERLSSRPVFARINPCSVCNLSCFSCIIYDDKEGIAKYPRPKGMMGVDTYRKIIDSLAGSLLQVILYDEGEPLLNKRIWEMVRYARDRRIRTVISSNLSFKMTNSAIAQLCESGLDYLIIALDGMTQEVYEQHRRSGQVALVKDNFERIMAYRKNHKIYRLEVEVEFIEFAANIEQKQQVIDYAKKHGADRVNCFLPRSVELADVASLKGKTRRHYGCFDLYAIADFDIDGSLFHCDFQEDAGADRIGNIHDIGFADMWNAPALRALRGSFRKAALGELDPLCAGCPVTRGLPFPLI